MRRCITELLLEWQALGDEECFARLAKAVHPIVVQTATRWLKRQRVFAVAHVDDVLSRVLDHLRRLHPGSTRERAVTLFRPEPDGCHASGLRYVRWLTRRRTQDLLRIERRRAHTQPTLTEAGIDAASIATLDRPAWNDAEERIVHLRCLRHAMESLADGEREVVARLLQGQSQSRVAAILGVSMGTISRRKRKAISQIRRMLCAGGWHPGDAVPPCAGATETPPLAAALNPAPCVTIQYETARAANATFVRHDWWCAFRCLMEGEGLLTDDGTFTPGESRKLWEYIDAHLHGRITLAQLAQVPGLSPGHFSRKFHRTFGMTPSRVVSCRRVQRVVDLLRSTDAPVEEIARSAGFCSPSHCTTTFRRVFGMPPSRFRAEELGRSPPG